MQTNQAIVVTHRSVSDPLRACVHDLRNLFAVVASAKSLLERPLDKQKKRIVMDALARVALEGKIVTNTLLTGEAEDRCCGSDAPAELRSLAAAIARFQRGRSSVIALVLPIIRVVGSDAPDQAPVVRSIAKVRSTHGQRSAL